jgi:hypothetical protein
MQLWRLYASVIDGPVSRVFCSYFGGSVRVKYYRKTGIKKAIRLIGLTSAVCLIAVAIAI